MKYFKTTTRGKISDSTVLISFLLLSTKKYCVAYRSLKQEANWLSYGQWLREYPPAEDYGEYVEISEQEALSLDKQLFEETFRHPGPLYEEYKQLECRLLETKK